MGVLLCGSLPSVSRARVTPHGKTAEPPSSTWGAPSFGLGNSSDGIEVVQDFDPLASIAVDRADLALGCGGFEPVRRAPGILVGLGDETVLDGILMHVIEPGLIRGVKRQFTLPKIEPDSAAGLPIAGVDLLCGVPMQPFQQL